MTRAYPEPQDVGAVIPAHLVQDPFRRGFHHAIRGRQTTEVEQPRLSFREGFRAGRLYLRELRRRRGIVSFPLQGRVRFKLH